MKDEDDDGFTLIELLLSMTILSVILASIVSAMIVFLKTGGDSSRRDDHSGGVAVVSTYLNRDLASADTLATTGTTCSGISNKVALSWTQWNATASSPVPAATGGMWTASYAVVSYSNTAIAGSPTRYQLTRYYCAPGQPMVSTILIKNLGATTDVSASLGSPDANCTYGLMSLTVKRYVGDSGSDDVLSSCLKGRNR